MNSSFHNVVSPTTPPRSKTYTSSKIDNSNLMSDRTTNMYNTTTMLNEPIATGALRLPSTSTDISGLAFSDASLRGNVVNKKGASLLLLSKRKQPGEEFAAGGSGSTTRRFSHPTTVATAATVASRRPLDNARSTAPKRSSAGFGVSTVQQQHAHAHAGLGDGGACAYYPHAAGVSSQDSSVLVEETTNSLDLVSASSALNNSPHRLLQQQQQQHPEEKKQRQQQHCCRWHDRGGSGKGKSKKHTPDPALQALLARMQQGPKCRRRSSVVADLRSYTPPRQPSEPGGGMPVASSHSHSHGDNSSSAGAGGVVSLHTVPLLPSPSGRRKRRTSRNGVGREDLPLPLEVSNSRNGFDNGELLHASLTSSELSMTRTEEEDDPAIVRETKLSDSASATAKTAHEDVVLLQTLLLMGEEDQDQNHTSDNLGLNAGVDPLLEEHLNLKTSSRNRDAEHVGLGAPKQSPSLAAAPHTGGTGEEKKPKPVDRPDGELDKSEFRRSFEMANSIGHLSDDDMLKAAIAESERAEQSSSSSGRSGAEREKTLTEDADVSPLVLDRNGIENAKANVGRILDLLCANDDDDNTDNRHADDVWQSLLDMCKKDQQRTEISIDAAFQRHDTDVYKLLDLNSNIVRAIERIESKLMISRSYYCQQREDDKTTMTPAAQKITARLLLVAMEAARHQREEEEDEDGRKRLEAAHALMKFARDHNGHSSPEHGNDDDDDDDNAQGEGSCTKQRTSMEEEGGPCSSLRWLQSLLDLFQWGESAYELKVVGAIAVAYALPLVIGPRTLVPLNFGSKIIECIRFLSTCTTSTTGTVVVTMPDGEMVTREECLKASALGISTFWTGILRPWLNSTGEQHQLPTGGGEKLQSSSTPPGSTCSSGFSSGVIQHLLEICVPLMLIRNNTYKNSCDKALVFQEDAYSVSPARVLLEEVCATDLARPIAVRNGILPILVKCIESEDSEEVTVAVRCLQSLAAVKEDKQLADLIHGQMVTEGVIERIVALTRRDGPAATSSRSSNHQVRLTIAQILSRLCTSGHARAREAVVNEANSTEFLMGFFVAHAREVSGDVARLMATALVMLAADGLRWHSDELSTQVTRVACLLESSGI